MDLAVRIFREAQRYIIGCGDERITGELLEHAASIAIKASKAVTDEIRRERSITALKRTRKTTSLPASADKARTQKTELVAIEGVPQSIPGDLSRPQDRKSTRLNSSHVAISYAVFCLNKKKK